MRGQNVSQPLPQSKLFASMDPGYDPYDPYDDPKDFGGGYALVRKDHLSVK